MSGFLFYEQGMGHSIVDRWFQNVQMDNHVFSQQKVGVHSIQKYMERMCAVAGTEGFKTGHSGKVTTATTLYNKGFDEQLIAGRTGHRSTAIRNYKRTSYEQIKAISDALQPPLPKAACTSGSSGVSAQGQRNALNESCTKINVQKNGIIETIF